MEQKNLLLGLLLVITVVFSGFILWDMNKEKLGDILGKNRAENWKWADRWDNNHNKPVEPEPVEPKAPSLPNEPQIIVNTYNEAIQKSGELGKPVLAFFTADWCTWCRKMKQETLEDSKVKDLMKNYILVYVDTDKDRVSTRKFGVQSLPSYVVTNFKENKLKFGSGFKDSNNFSTWLNDSSLFNQPKFPETNDRLDKPRRPQQPDCGPNG